MDSTDSSWSGWEFAKIFPQGEEAEKALDRVYDDPNLSDHHRAFIRVERKQRAEDSGSDNSSSKQGASTQAAYWAGHYSLSLEDPAKSISTLGWLIGRGTPSDDSDNHRVDILLIRPKTKTHGVAPVHARIQFHTRSGVLMLFGLHTDRPVHYDVHDEFQRVSLTNGQSHVLYQMINSFTVGNLHYKLIFRKFTQAQHSDFVDQRNALLYGPEDLWPHLELSAVPRPQDIKRGSVITHGTVGYGKFGRFFPGVYARNGEAVAIKQHQPTNQGDMETIGQEAKIGIRFSGVPGLLAVDKIWCEHDFDRPCGRFPQSVYTSSPLALQDFSRLNWPRFGSEEVMEVFRGPLQGLCALHGEGYMHRDVSAKNLLLTSLRPPQAVLGDYGKAIKAASDRNPYIGPAHYCAPEVDGVGFYDNKIDVWSMGVVLITALEPTLSRKSTEQFSDWYDRTNMSLNNSVMDQDGWKVGAARMLMGMLTLDPAKRSSAAEALADMPPPHDNA
ncbi:MAG: hypothetical protein Q9170_006520 [Blastenia crenularia]